MICELYTLKREYRDKKIYIWDVNRDSIGVFTSIAIMKINVKGFVTLQKKYVGERFMNRPVVAFEQIEKDEDIIILVPDGISRNIINMLPDEKVVYWSDSLEIDEELRQRGIIIYGTGYGAEKIRKILDKEGIAVDLYCVTKVGYTVKYEGKPVIEPSELIMYEDYAVIISVITLQYRREILETLSGFQGRIYIENIIIGEAATSAVEHIDLMQNLDLALKRHKKIYLYSKKNMLAELVEEMLHIYGIELAAYVSDIEDEKEDIKSIYELAYEGVEDKLIIINEEFPEPFIRARECVELAGFSLEERNYTGIQLYTRAKDTLLQKTPYYNDSLLGYSILYPQGKASWKIYGKEENDRIRILILGGSTSAEVWHPENWVSKLYYKLNQNHIKTTIYNGAHEGNSIVEEILRLLRDGSVLKPHIVISLSGVNDIAYKKSSNQFNENSLINWIESLAPHSKYCSGVYSGESLYSFWSRNVKLLKLVSEFYGARFFGFLQPMNIPMCHMSFWEKTVYERDRDCVGARDFEQSSCDGDDYINIMKLFEGRNEMYFDRAHYTDKGHEMIASKVYETIISTIQALKNV